MKLYFAGKWGAQNKINDLRRMLHGAVNTSTWLGISPETDSSLLDSRLRWNLASDDLADVKRADALVLVNGLLGPGDDFGNFKVEFFPTSPGRFLEFGYALALGKPVYVIGFLPYSVFYSHPLVRMFSDDSEFIEWFNGGRS